MDSLNYMSNLKNPKFTIQVREAYISDIYATFSCYAASLPRYYWAVESVGARLSSRGSLTLWASWEGAKPALLWQRMGKQLMLLEEKCFYSCLLSSFQRTEPHLFRMKNWDSMILTGTRLITTTTAITTHLTKVRYVPVTELKAFHIVFHLILPKQTSRWGHRSQGNCLK